ncbi:TonB-dependent receptor [Parahaliea aestuarii]|uniref:TonB-dependent receptor n=1 Tax=Parahaliea aestuarii TaxID=1852021 RepID=A0A5C8ZNQ3_9GAMM|nr:TonB-dependent receptor [Parahaliea aestuarii]TXS89370.1 TonB-dependent receptor [Parahaliea aestuarii]
MKAGLMKYSILGAAVSAASLSMAASAQVSSAQEGAQLEEVLVTASRREQKLQDVPAAVVAVAPEDFKFQGLQQVSDIFAYTPGVTFDDSGAIGRGTISARGVPQVLAIPVFGVYLDDTPLSPNTNFAGGGTFLDGLLMDLERIEVIKGPQGTLYGATSVGGMMRYISRDPALDEMRGTISVDANEIENGESGNTISGTISLPLIKDTLGVTLSGFRQDRGGYVDYVNPATGQVVDEDVDQADNEGGSFDLLYRPVERLDLRFKYVKQEATFDIASTVQLAGIDSDDAMFGDYTTISEPGAEKVEYEIIAGTLNYDFDWATLTFNSSNVELSYGQQSDFTSAIGGLLDQVAGQPPGTTTLVVADLQQGSDKYVQELRLTSAPSDTLEWIAGVYYTEEETFNNQVVSATPVLPFEVLSAKLPSDYKELAGFGDVTYYFTPAFDVTAGVRVSRSEVTLQVDTAGILAGESSFSGDKIEDTVDTYLLAASYRPTDDLSLYGRIASGYRPAMTNLPLLDPVTGENLADPLIESDEVWSYELGAKGQSANGLLGYDLALWMLDWDNFQTTIFANGVNTGANAEDGLSAYGMEGELTINPTDNLTFLANIAYADSTLNDDEPGLGGVDGEQVPNLPEWTASLRWNYDFPLMGDWRGTFSGGVRYTGEYESAYSQSTTNQAVKVDSRTLTDVNLSVNYENYTVGVYATNLFDERALNSRTDQIAGPGVFNSTGVFERPRTIGVNLRYDF